MIKAPNKSIHAQIRIRGNKWGPLVILETRGQVGVNGLQLRAYQTGHIRQGEILTGTLI